MTFLGSWVLLIALSIISKILDTFVNYDAIKITLKEASVHGHFSNMLGLYIIAERVTPASRLVRL